MRQVKDRTAKKRKRRSKSKQYCILCGSPTIHSGKIKGVQRYTCKNSKCKYTFLEKEKIDDQIIERSTTHYPNIVNAAYKDYVRVFSTLAELESNHIIKASTFYKWLSGEYRSSKIKSKNKFILAGENRKALDPVINQFKSFPYLLIQARAKDISVFFVHPNAKGNKKKVRDAANYIKMFRFTKINKKTNQFTLNILNVSSKTISYLNEKYKGQHTFPNRKKIILPNLNAAEFKNFDLDRQLMHLLYISAEKLYQRRYIMFQLFSSKLYRALHKTKQHSLINKIRNTRIRKTFNNIFY